MGVSSGAEPKRRFRQIRLEDRLQNQERRRLHHPVAHVGNAQRPHLPVGLRNVHAADRPGLVAPLAQRARETLKKSVNAEGLDRLDRHPIRPRRSLVAPHPFPRHPKEPRACDLVIQLMKAPCGFPLGAEMQLVLEFPHHLFGCSRSVFRHAITSCASVHFKRGTTRRKSHRGASLRGHCPASPLLSPPPTPAPARTVFGCALAKRPEVMRFGCESPPLRGRSPELRSRSVPRGRQSRPGRPDDPAAAPCRLRLLYGLGYQPSSDAQRLGLRSKIYRGSYGFTGVTARRFATATPCVAGGLTRRT